MIKDIGKAVGVPGVTKPGLPPVEETAKPAARPETTVAVKPLERTVETTVQEPVRVTTRAIGYTDPQTQHYVVQVMDTDKGRTVAQYPTDSLLRLYAAMDAARKEDEVPPPGGVKT